jgi:hypothetical protein
VEAFCFFESRGKKIIHGRQRMTGYLFRLLFLFLAWRGFFF